MEEINQKLEGVQLNAEGYVPFHVEWILMFRSEKKVNSAAVRKAAKEARRAEIERAQEVKWTQKGIFLINSLGCQG